MSVCASLLSPSSSAFCDAPSHQGDLWADFPPTQRCNYVHEYDTGFNLVRRHVLNTDWNPFRTWISPPPQRMTWRKEPALRFRRSA